MISTSYLRALAKRWKFPALARIRIDVNYRFTSTAGRWVARSNAIEISQAVAGGSARERREVICHEAAHIVVWYRYGKTVRPHGAEWAELVRFAGFDPRAHLARSDTRRYSTPRVFTFRH